MSGPAESPKRTLSLTIGRLDFSISCAPEEEPALRAAAEYWRRAVEKAAEQSRHLGLERHAMLAGINLANELLSLQSGGEAGGSPVGERLEALNQRLAEALETPETPETPPERAGKG